MDIETLNLVGTPCPLNFVTIKTTLDRLDPGVRVRVRLDPDPVGSDVAASLRDNGYDVLSVSVEAEAYVAVVRRRPLVSASGSAGYRRRSEGGCTKTGRRKNLR